MSADNLTGFLQYLEKSLAIESLASTPDSKLLERFIASRDDLACRAIVARHGPMVYRVCRRVLSDDRDAEDAFQAVFLVLIREAHSIRKRKSLASWLHGVARQTALRARTSSQRRHIRESMLARRDEAITADDGSWNEVRAILDEELARLPEQLKAPLVLCYLESLTQDEAAEQLGQKKRTLQRCLERGRAILGLRLMRRGITLSAALMATLVSDCVEAMPPHIITAAASFVEGACRKDSRAFSQSVIQLAEEVIKSMSFRSLELKWTVAALLSACVGSVAVGSLFVGLQQPDGSQGLGQDAINRHAHLNTSLGPDFQKSQEVVQKREVNPRRKTISPEIVETWVKAGASFGQVKFTDIDVIYIEDGLRDGELPGFYVSNEKLDLSKLPPPDAPFGLWCYSRSPQWDHIAAFKNLRALRTYHGLGIKALATLDQLRTLTLDQDRAALSDGDLKELATLQHLETLCMPAVHTTVAVIKELASLRHLQTLSLYRMEIVGESQDSEEGDSGEDSRPRPRKKSAKETTDLAIKELVALRQLRGLILQKTLITDVGVKELAALESLQRLDLSKTEVTDEGVKHLKPSAMHI